MFGILARAAGWLAARSVASGNVLAKSGRWVLQALGFATVFDAAVDVATTPGASLVTSAPPADEVRAQAKLTLQSIGLLWLAIAAGLIWWLIRRK